MNLEEDEFFVGVPPWGDATPEQHDEVHEWCRRWLRDHGIEGRDVEIPTPLGVCRGFAVIHFDGVSRVIRDELFPAMREKWEEIDRRGP